MISKFLFTAMMPVLFFVHVSAQSRNPDQILDNLKQNFKKVEDYKVDVGIKVDVNFLKVPDMHATVYFKKPDKIHIESKNFALLPRQGFNFSPESFLEGKYTAIFDKDTTLSGYPAAVIKIIPLNDNSSVVLTTLWIDLKNDVIRHIQSTTKTAGTFSLSFEYPDKIIYPLPEKMTFTFNADKLKFRGRRNHEQGQNGDSGTGKFDSNESTGSVYVTYTNYRVNEGIPDSVFDKENNKKKADSGK